MKKVIRFLLVAALVATLWLPAAAASALGRDWGLGAGLGTSALWVGQQRNADGTLVYCADQPLAAPSTGTPYVDPVTGGFVRADGSKLTPGENAAVSYLVNTWGGTTDNSQAAAVQLAVWSLTTVDAQFGSATMAQILAKAQVPAPVLDSARGMRQQALALSGPYRVDLALDAETGATVTTQPGTKAAVRVLAASGAPVEGVPVTVTASGSLMLTSGDKVTSAKDPAPIGLRRASGAAGTLTATATGLPAEQPTWLKPQAQGGQRLFLLAAGTTASATASVDTAAPVRPGVSTSSSPEVITAPGGLTDRLTVTLPEGVTWPTDATTGKPLTVSVESKLWGPFPAEPVTADAVPADAPLAGTTHTAITGAGSVTTAPLPASKPGYYVFTGAFEAVPAQSASAPLAGWRSGFAEPGEVSLLKFSPSVATEVDNGIGVVGTNVTDSLSKVVGFPPGSQPADVKLSVYGPLPSQPAQSASVPEGAPLLGSVHVTAQEGESVTLPMATQPGCYTVVARLSAGKLSNAFTSDFGLPEESYCLTAPSTPSLQGTPPVAEQRSAPQGPDTLAATGFSPWAMIPAGLALICLGAGGRLLLIRARNVSGLK